MALKVREGKTVLSDSLLCNPQFTSGAERVCLEASQKYLAQRLGEECHRLFVDASLHKSMI